MTCLVETLSNCITFSAGLKTRLAALGYTSSNFEDLVMELISKGGGNLAGQINELKTRVEGLNADTIPAGAKMYGLRSGSVHAAQITNRSVEYYVDGEQVTYDFSKLLNELPDNIAYLGARVDVVDDKGKRASTQGKRGTITAPSLPANITLSVDLQSPDGGLTLEKTVYVQSDVDKSALLNVRDYTSAPADLSIRGAIEALAAEAALNKR